MASQSQDAVTPKHPRPLQAPTAPPMLTVTFHCALPTGREATPHFPTKSGWQRMGPLFAGLIAQGGNLLAMYLSAYDVVIFKSQAASVVP